MQTRLYIRPETKTKLDKLIANSGITYVQWLDDAVNYFKDTGVNPGSEFSNIKKSFQHLDDLIKRRTDAIIGFIRQGEKEYLIPISNSQKELLDVYVDSNIHEPIALVGSDIVGESYQHNVTAPTLLDEENYKLKEELELTRRNLSAIINNLDVVKTNIGSVRYELKISEAFYNELRTMQFD